MEENFGFLIETEDGEIIVNEDEDAYVYDGYGEEIDDSE